MNYLIIAAGGNGKRIGLNQNKIFADLSGKPLICWTLKFLEESKVIGKIVISAKREDIEKINLIIKKYQFRKILMVVEASQTRQESILTVLKWLKPKINKKDLVGVHNAVNLFITNKEINQVYDAAKKFRTALLACPAKDTVKISNEKNIVEGTPQRRFSWYAQTPQVANFGDLWQAFIKASKDKFIGTDDTQLLERIGVKARIVPCSYLNFKITYPEDLIMAREVLKIFKS